MAGKWFEFIARRVQRRAWLGFHLSMGLLLVGGITPPPGFVLVRFFFGLFGIFHDFIAL